VIDAVAEDVVEPGIGATDQDEAADIFLVRVGVGATDARDIHPGRDRTHAPTDHVDLVGPGPLLDHGNRITNQLGGDSIVALPVTKPDGKHAVPGFGEGLHHAGLGANCIATPVGTAFVGVGPRAIGGVVGSVDE